MRSALRWLERFWFAEAPAARLALLRIVIGGYALYSLNDRFNLLLRIAATNPNLFEPVGPVSFLTGPITVPAFRLLLTATLALNVAFVLGLRHRITGPLFALALLWVLSYRNSWGMIFHTDNLLVLHVLVLGLTRSADAFSIDALTRSPRAQGPLSVLTGWRPRVVDPSWQYGYPIRLLCLGTALTYVLSGVAKLSGPLGASWTVGESLRLQVAFDVWRKELLAADPPRLIFSLYDQIWLFTALAVGTVVIELGAPLALVSGWIAAIWVPAALLMHWGILLIMGIDFPYQLYGVAFVPFVPVDRVLSWLQPKRVMALLTLARQPGPAARLRSLLLRAGLLACVLLFTHGVGQGVAEVTDDIGSQPRTQSPQPFAVVWVGDVLLGHEAQQVLDAQGYAWPFEHLRDVLRADFVVGNAEGPMTAREGRYFPEQRWSYSAHPEAARALADAGFDALSLANNHAFDRGPGGLLDTIDSLRRADIRPFGAGADLDQAATPLMIETPHGRVAVFGLSEGGVYRPSAGPERPGILEIDPTTLASYRARAIQDGARWVVGYVHWGSNYAPVRAHQRRIATAFAEAGFDLVIGHHPHVIQPIEVIHAMPVLYSLGNFTFGAAGRFSDEFPGYGVVARTVLDERGLLTIELTCIVTDNAIVHFQPRPCSEQESQSAMDRLGPSVIWRDGKGLVQLR